MVECIIIPTLTAEGLSRICIISNRRVDMCSVVLYYFPPSIRIENATRAEEHATAAHITVHNAVYEKVITHS